VLIDERKVIIVYWILGMQECGLSITLQQLKLKVAKLIQTQVTPFKGGI
jgi:hypothetical protein